MTILVLNSGSSSIKFSIFESSGDALEPTPVFDGELTGFDGPQARLVTSSRGHAQDDRSGLHFDSGAAAVAFVLDTIAKAAVGEIAAVGHRVVHPGMRIRNHTRITDEILVELEAAVKFAPLHDPEAIAILRETIRKMPAVPQFACFDTVFHQTMPEEASIYALPKEIRDQGIRRYGFHGLSCESIVREMRLAGVVPERMVIAHLGSGCSVTALKSGVSIDTTMGLTPTGGVVMGTRPGDLDPGVLLYLQRQKADEKDGRDLERMLNYESGTVALTEMRNDMRLVRQAADGGEPKAVLALKVFTRSIRKAIGGYAWLLGGLDAVVFSGGIGEHDAATRSEVLSETEAVVDSTLNAAKGNNMRTISSPNARTAVYVVPAQEDFMIALHVTQLFQAAA